ncbi:MAG: IS5 family transposase [Saprospiraceae bacterium]
MLTKKVQNYVGSLFSTFEEQLVQTHPLYILSHRINWKIFDESFKIHYSERMGAPSKPIRRMVGLLILKHLRNLSDESIVEQWQENVYYQYFCGETMIAQGIPCVPTELVEFRKRIGESGMELILSESIRVNGKDGEEKESITDTTVQEKNITYPTDSKFHAKIIAKCQRIALDENIEVRQSYRMTIKKLNIERRHRTNPKNYKKAIKADRKIKTIAGRLLRELNRRLEPNNKYVSTLQLFEKVLQQKRHDSNKIYSLHEPNVQCISKGKQHKKFEFGNKVSIMSTKSTGVIIGAMSFEKNDYDAHTLDKAIEQQQKLSGIILENTFVDHGYRGIKEVRGTKINSPRIKSTDSQKEKQRLRKGFRRRAAIEPIIAHLKSDYRMYRNYYKGIVGDQINVLLAAAAWNFKRMINKWKNNPLFDLFSNIQDDLLTLIKQFFFPKVETLFAI